MSERPTETVEQDRAIRYEDGHPHESHEWVEYTAVVTYRGGYQRPRTGWECAECGVDIEDDEALDPCETVEHGEDDERKYPCAHSGCTVMRTKAEGGTVFSVCDKHWAERYGRGEDDIVEPTAWQIATAVVNLCNADPIHRDSVARYLEEKLARMTYAPNVSVHRKRAARLRAALNTETDG